MKRMSAADGAAVYLKAIVFNLLVQLIAGIVVLIVSATTDGAAINIINYLFMLLLQAAFALALLTTVRSKKRSLAYGFRKISPITAIISVGLAFMSVACFSLPAQWFSFALEKIGFEASALTFDSGAEIALAVLAAGIIAPVAEEMVFRGALTGGLMKKTKPWLAIIIGAACFALMHMNPEQTVYQFLLGCVAGTVAYCSGSVIPAIIVHFVNNAAALVMSLLPVGSGELAPSWGLFGITAGAFAVGTVLLILAAKAIMKKEKGDEALALLTAEQAADDELEAENGGGALLGKRSHTIMISIAVGVCALMWLITLGASVLAA